jgi:tetratricopeptide (TPR) repeat protein
MVPHTNLGALYANLGQYEKAIAETEASQRLELTINSSSNLAGIYINVNRLKDARQTIQEAQHKSFDDFFIRSDLYSLAFLSGDTAEMEREVAWAPGRPSEEDQMLNTHADTQAYYGRLGKARYLARRLLTPPCARMPRKLAPSGSFMRDSVKLNSATSLRRAKASPAH